MGLTWFDTGFDIFPIARWRRLYSHWWVRLFFWSLYGIAAIRKLKIHREFLLIETRQHSGSGGSNLTLEAGLLNDPDNLQIAHFDHTAGPLYPEM
jgi:hypothetical protein